jgi:hypothetical protein
MDTISFNDLKAMVANFLRNSKNADPSNALNEYFGSIPEEQRIKEAEELMILLVNRTAKPQTKEDAINSGNIGVITMGLPYAYSLLLTVLSWWVYAVYHTGTAKELTLEEKQALRQRLKDGIYRYDWLGADPRHYDSLLDQLVPAESVKTIPPALSALAQLKARFSRK